MPVTAATSIPPRPLQTFMTIRSLKGRLNNLTIGLCGDLKFGRTVHSLINALVRYTGHPIRSDFPGRAADSQIISVRMSWMQTTLNSRKWNRLEDALPELDILYMTRVQKERFFNEEDYVRMKDFYILNKEETGTG